MGYAVAQRTFLPFRHATEKGLRIGRRLGARRGRRRDDSKGACCGRAIYSRRKDMRALVGESRFQANPETPVEPQTTEPPAPAIQGARLRPVEVDRQRPNAARSLRWTRAGAQPLTVFKSMLGAMKPKMTSQMAGIAPRATDQKANAPAGWKWPPMILDHRAQKATTDATEKN